MFKSVSHQQLNMADSTDDEFSDSPGPNKRQKPQKGTYTLKDMFARQRQRLADRDKARGAKKMLKDIDSDAVVADKQARTRGWTSEKLVAGPASGKRTFRVVLSKERFDPVWWTTFKVDSMSTKERGPNVNVGRHGLRPAPLQNARQQAAAARRARTAADHEARLQALDAMAGKIQEQFEEEFSWEQRKLIVAQSYYSERLAIARVRGTVHCSIAHATSVAAKSAFVSYKTAANWLHDHMNNGGWFSPSFWGCNTKTASIVGDIDTKRWAREWVINNMGHRTGRRNMYAKDFNEPLHEKLGLVWDAAHPTICDSAARKLLLGAGAVFTKTKIGYTHCDNHGADHVAKGQRPAFLDMYNKLYARGPNYLKIGEEWVDKDTILGRSSTWSSHHHMLQEACCKGPRGMGMCGAMHPGNVDKPLPFCPGIDFPGRVWHIACHDEACIHALKGEQGCWLIPGVDMGDIPPKSDGEYEHLAEVDAELEGGTISLTRLPGQISRQDMRKYIKAKRERQVAYPVPHFSTVRMHAGSGGEGAWFGDDAKDHFELIIDIFDIVFNMPWIEDPAKATVGDLLAVTKEQRAIFPHGLAVQGDRSQGHLKMAPDCPNANKIRKKVGGGQPHFRHMFAMLPAGKTHWRECRAALCEPGCAVCQAAVDEHGHRPDFMSIGRKGSDIVLRELGLVAGHLCGKKQKELLKTVPGWVLQHRKSQVQELFLDRGHFFLIGAACHAELASKEHGWARLKAQVKPYVDGKMEKLRSLIAAAITKFGLRERLLDAARCRRVMCAYIICADRGEDATADKLKLWEREHSKHRDVHLGELAALQQHAGLHVREKDAKIAAKMVTQGAMRKRMLVKEAAHVKHMSSLKRSFYNRRDRKREDVKQAAKARWESYKARVESGQVHKDRVGVRALKKI